MSAAAEGTATARHGDADLPRQLRILRPIADRTGEERVRRVIAFGFLPAAVVFGLLALPVLAQQADDFPVWWNWAVVAGVLLVPSVMGAVAFVAPLGTLRTLAAVTAATALLAQATLPMVVDATSLDGSQAPWIDDVASLGTILAVLALRPLWTVLVALASAGLTVVDRTVVTTDRDPLPGVQNGLYVFLFCITFIALGFMTLRRVRDADVAEAAATQAATDAAADAARERERGRINALVHDRVLATLLAAARPVPGSEALRRADAARALEGLQALLGDEDPAAGAELDGEEFVWTIQAATTELAPEATFSYEVHSDFALPPAAIEALTAATEEALRNSVLHAGAANRSVHVHIGEDGAQVDVLDDGVGFDPTAVPATRLGISESIRGRMEALPGGGAVVVSSRGVGTRVQLKYRPGAH